MLLLQSLNSVMCERFQSELCWTAHSRARSSGMNKHVAHRMLAANADTEPLPLWIGAWVASHGASQRTLSNLKTRHTSCSQTNRVCLEEPAGLKALP